MKPEVRSVAARSRSYRGVLRDRGLGVGRTILPSMILHLPVALLLMGSLGGSRDHDLRMDRDVYMVSAITLPKADGLPDRASAPRPTPPASPETGTKPPPPPEQMVLEQEEAEEDKGQPEPVSQKKEEPVRPSRADLLAGLNVDEGELRFETDPDGAETTEPELGLVERFGRPLNAYERRVRDAIQYNWFPKYGGRINLKLWAAVGFNIDDKGTIRDPRIERSSGDFVYDQSCLRAVSRTRRVPPPPPDANRSISVGFSPEDKQ